jgi:hypothetical protein
VIAEGRARPGLTEAELADMQAEATDVSPELAAKLSIFWSDIGFAIGRFPPLDRIDYLDHGVALIDRIDARPPRPSITEVQHYLSGRPWTNWTESVQRLLKQEQFAAADRKPYLRALLYPARFLYSWSSGAIASNDVAVAFLSTCPVPGLDLEIIEAALRCRREPEHLDVLFNSRGLLRGQLRACSAFAGLPAAST